MSQPLGLKEWQEAETDLGRAYLRLRSIIGRRAFDTPFGPSPEQVWETTEKALMELIAERDALIKERDRLRRDIITALNNTLDGEGQ